jgi:hypothetical protein
MSDTELIIQGGAVTVESDNLTLAPGPATPKRLQVVERVVEVLQSITAGADYYYTPYAVTKRYVEPDAADGFPFYMVHIDGSTERPESHLDSEYVETIVVSVKGYVKCDLNENVTIVSRCIRDVQRAIDRDSRSTSVGSLGQLTVSLDIDTYTTDSGLAGLDGFGLFEQRIVVRVEGDWGEL